jgi:hypothetical protein
MKIRWRRLVEAAFVARRCWWQKMMIKTKSLIFCLLISRHLRKGMLWCLTIRYLQRIPTIFFRLSTFIRDAIFRVELVTWSVPLAQKELRNCTDPQPVRRSTLKCTAFLRVKLVTWLTTLSFDMTCTWFYSLGERCNHHRWLGSNVTPTLLFFLHALCVPDQIRVLVSG